MAAPTRARILAVLDAKQQALELYGRHLDGCDYLVHYGHCTCGLLAAQKEKP